jgi:NTP pyrophosphatase (non-canonical NTP hydrolase)
VGDPIGYHLREIDRGEYGEASKIFEEAYEFADALDQGSALMALIELSDMVGAIKGFLAKHHPTITLADLDTMSVITQRVFESGYRESK